VPFSETVQKVNYLAGGNGGHPGQALDVDHNPTTCSPYGDCEAGLDNQLSDLFDQIAIFVDVDQQLMAALDGGVIVLVAELVGIKFDGGSFSMNMYIAEPAVSKGVCNFQTSKCAYLVHADAIDTDACQPLITFDNAKIVDGLLTAGGLDYEFILPLALFAGPPFLVTLHDARISAVVDIAQGGAMTLDGVIAGAIPKQLLLDGVEGLPDDALPIDKSLVKSLLNMVVTNDIDTNGDGVKESASIGLPFGALDGAITGVIP